MAQGDLAVSLVSGEVDEYTPSGAFVQKLMDATNGLGVPTGSAFDGAGNLYVTDFTNNQILKRDVLTGAVSVFATNSSLGNGHTFNSPESIVFNRGYSQMFLSGANRNGPGGGINVLSTATGAGIDFYPLPSSSGSDGTGESDWLAFDPNSTLFMTNENSTQGVMKVDPASKDVVQPSFAPNLPNIPYGLSFDKSGNLWVADTDQIMEFAPSGSLTRTISGFTQAFAAVFNPAGDQFYAGDLTTGAVYTYDVNGNLQGTFNAGSGVSGLSVAGAAVPPNGRPKNYVALGDSYASGEGNPPFDPGTDVYKTASRGARAPLDTCHRSPVAWPRLDGVTQSWHLACSGAKVDDLFHGQWPKSSLDNVGQIPRLQSIEQSLAGQGKHVDVVTLTIGGNDFGFSDKIGDCFLKICLRHFNQDERRVQDLKNKIEKALGAIKLAAPYAHVVLVGYPRLFPSQQSGNVACGWLDPGERGRANTLSADFDIMFRQAATDQGVEFVSVADALDGHELCSADSWVFEINPLRFGTSPLQGHPLVNGQRSMAAIVAPHVG